MMLFERMLEDYVYAKINEKEVQNCNTVLFVFREKENTNCVLTLKEAQSKQLEYSFLCTVFRLVENTSLTAVGITAKVASALAKKGIPCNVVAAFHHDYFLVPKHLSETAFELLNALD